MRRKENASKSTSMDLSAKVNAVENQLPNDEVEVLRLFNAMALSQPQKHRTKYEKRA